jgi:hypothetical protein
MQTESAQQTDQLILLKRDFSAPSTVRKLLLLKQLSSKMITDAAALKKYHETLLFILAYPDNKELYTLALQQIRQLKRAAEDIFCSYAPRKQSLLNGSGIFASELVYAFSYEITSWLSTAFGGSISLHSSNAEPELVSRILSLFLPAVEYQEITQGNYSLPKRIERLTGKKNSSFALRWLLHIFHNSKIPPSVCSSLYEQLQVYVNWKLDHPFFNRTFLRSLPLKRVCFHDSMPVLKDHQRYISKKINAAEEISAEEKIKLLDIARAALALHGRETDPLTYGNSNNVEYFDMGHGISIALYTMLPQNRFSIESYIGYMAFVNSVPAAYGGGWLLGHRCKIGISIFPTLRGGNSALLFAAILRLYHCHFNANRFVVKPYQFGKNNPDGLHSGAFWFYYKMGFRPADTALQKLAEEENKKRSTLKNYKTDIEVLREFTTAPLELLMNNNVWPGYDAAHISKTVTRNIVQYHQSDRKQALSYYTRQMKRLVTASGRKITSLQQRILARQALWMSILFPNNKKMSGWTKADKQQLIQLLLSKYGPDERDYIVRLQKHKKIWKIIDRSTQI